MAVDHSQTYTSPSLKNLPHRMRLKAIFALLDSHIPPHPIDYADFGCSNGFITAMIAERYGLKNANGFDHDPEHVAAAQDAYPAINFASLDLNTAVPSARFDVVTCFETLEHVGQPARALETLVSATRQGGMLFITVPIETGVRGLVKFVPKMSVYRGRYRDDLRELSAAPIGVGYFKALLLNRDLSRFRSEPRLIWHTHFGFDYRIIDAWFRDHGLRCHAENRFTSRLYAVEC